MKKAFIFLTLLGFSTNLWAAKYNCQLKKLNGVRFRTVLLGFPISDNTTESITLMAGTGSEDALKEKILNGTCQKKTTCEIRMNDDYNANRFGGFYIDGFNVEKFELDTGTKASFNQAKESFQIFCSTPIKVY